MASHKPSDWVQALMSRYEQLLPVKCGSHTSQSLHNLEQCKQCLINVSRHKFSMVMSGLTTMLKAVDNIKIHQKAAEQILFESQNIVLDTLEKVLAGQPKDTQSRLEEMKYVQILLPEVCTFFKPAPSSESLPNHQRLRHLASKVIFALSQNNFAAISSRISHSLEILVNIDENDRTELNSEFDLIMHIDVDKSRVIKIFNEVNSKARFLRKHQSTNNLILSLERAIWNWMDNYPMEFLELQEKQQDDMVECCDRMFDNLNAMEGTKRKAVVWPLQMMLLTLCPKILEEIINADSGAPLSPQHLKKKQFIDEVKKALNPHHSSSSSKH